MSREIVLREFPESLYQKYPDISFYHGGKGPLFPTFLGTWYKLLNTQGPDIFYHASIFTNIIASAFLGLFYYFVRTRFNQKTAIVSCSILVSLSLFTILSARVHPYILLMFISLCLLFFLEKKKSHYLIGGFFASLAPLTHPFGIFVTFSFILFLLSKREFKGVAISSSVIFFMLLPFLFFNFYYTGDFGWGLYIPFSDVISENLTFLPRDDERTIISPYTNRVIENVNRDLAAYNLEEIFSKYYERSITFYGWDLLFYFYFFQFFIILK